MTLVDNETGENIINPYITIFNYSKEKNWVAINTSTFGHESQRNLLNIIDEKNFMEQECWKGDKWYKICATVGKQDHPYDWSNDLFLTCRGLFFARGVRANGANDAIALVPLGHLHEDVIRKHFPKSYAYFEECKRRAAGENIPEQGPGIAMSIGKIKKL